MAFVATSAPAGWKLGRWSQVNTSTWQEEKLDNPKIVYQFQVVGGKSNPGSSTVRLKMKDQNTEVLLLDSSAQIFVNGSYFGEYGGEWQAGGRQGGSKPTPAAAGRQQPAARAAPEPAFERAPAPAQASSQKAPSKQSVAPAAPDRSAYMSTVPEFRRSGKPDGLDKSEQSMQKLIDAAKSGDVNKVKQLLAEGIDPDGPAKNGSTPLMVATAAGHKAVIEALIEACADPTLGKGEETPLTIAFQKGKQEILKVLMNATFNTMNGVVGPAALDLSGFGVENDCTEWQNNAENDLREITQMIAKVNKGDGPDSPTSKYGNYAHMASKTDMEDKDSDMLRTEAVRLAMTQITRNTK